MPIPEELFHSIGDSNIFIIMDMRQGFNHIVLIVKDHKTTTFHGSNKLWELLVMPFGLKNAPVFFQRVIDQVLEGANFLKCWQGTPSSLGSSWGVIQEVPWSQYGDRIFPNAITAHWAKVVAILEMTNPTDVHTFRSFIELCNYYRIYVQDFNTIVHLLYALLKKDVVWTWREEAQDAFNTLREKLSKFPIWRKSYFNKVFILHTNCSAFGIGVIFGQLDEKGKEYVITYASWSNNKAGSNYASYEGECLVVVWVVIHFRPYLYGTKFILNIDHQLIKWFMTNDKLTGKLVVRRLYFRSMSSRLFTNLILHIKTQIPCCRDPSLPLKISQKLSKTSTRF